MHTNRGSVSVWLNKVAPSAYPVTYFDEHYGDDRALCKWSEKFGFGFYDHDSMEVVRTDGEPQTLSKLLSRCSYIDTFIDDVERAAKGIGIVRVNHVILLYDFDYAAGKERIDSDGIMLFLGTFHYHCADD